MLVKVVKGQSESMSHASGVVMTSSKDCQHELTRPKCECNGYISPPYDKIGQVAWKVTGFFALFVGSLSFVLSARVIIARSRFKAPSSYLQAMHYCH